MVHVLLKPGMENFEHYFASMWDECNCAVVWTFFGIAFLWDRNENWPFPEEPEIKLPTSAGSLKKQASSRKTSTSALLTMPKPLTVWKILKEMGIPDHLTCLLRIYAGQEATDRSVRGTTDSFQIGKGVLKGCILSPCIFNLYAEYIMRNTRLDEA